MCVHVPPWVQGPVPGLQLPEWHHPGRHLRSHLAAVSGGHVCDAVPAVHCCWHCCPPGAPQLTCLVVCVGCRVPDCTLVCGLCRILYVQDNSLVGSVPSLLAVIGQYGDLDLSLNCFTDCTFAGGTLQRQPWCSPCAGPVSPSPAPSASPSPSPSPSGSATPGVPSAQRVALQQLYSATGGQGWASSQGWLTGDPCVGAWYGVGCSSDNHAVTYVCQGRASCCCASQWLMRGSGQGGCVFCSAVHLSV